MLAGVLTYAATAGVCVKVSPLVTQDCTAIKNERFCMYPCDWFESSAYTYDYEDLAKKNALDAMLDDTRARLDELEPSPSPVPTGVVETYKSWYFDIEPQPSPDDERKDPRAYDDFGCFWRALKRNFWEKVSLTGFWGAT